MMPINYYSNEPSSLKELVRSPQIKAFGKGFLQGASTIPLVATLVASAAGNVHDIGDAVFQFTSFLIVASPFNAAIGAGHGFYKMISQPYIEEYENNVIPLSIIKEYAGVPITEENLLNHNIQEIFPIVKKKEHLLRIDGDKNRLVKISNNGANLLNKLLGMELNEPLKFDSRLNLFEQHDLQNNAVVKFLGSKTYTKGTKYNSTEYLGNRLTNFIFKNFSEEPKYLPVNYSKNF